MSHVTASLNDCNSGNCPWIIKQSGGVIKWREFLVTKGVLLGGDSGRPGTVHAYPTGGAGVQHWYTENKERDCTPVLQQKCAMSVKCKNTGEASTVEQKMIPLQRTKSPGSLYSVVQSSFQSLQGHAVASSSHLPQEAPNTWEAPAQLPSLPCFLHNTWPSLFSSSHCLLGMSNLAIGEEEMLKAAVELQHLKMPFFPCSRAVLEFWNWLCAKKKERKEKKSWLYCLPGICLMVLKKSFDLTFMG